MSSFDITNHVDYNKHFASYIKRSECERRLKTQRPCNITKHPEYKKMQKKLKEKYAIKDTSTCPPTYKECNVEGHPRFVYQAKTIASLKKQLESSKASLSLSPQYKAMQRVLRSLKRKNEKLRKSVKTMQSAEHIKSIEKTIMEKYACKDTSTCPPTYKKCDKTSCRKVESHPKYIKLQNKLARLEKKLAKQAALIGKSQEENNPGLASVNDHPMFLEMKRGYKKEIRELEQKISLLKEFEIKFKSHRCKECKECKECPSLVVATPETVARVPGISEERYDELYRKYANQGEELSRLRSKNSSLAKAQQSKQEHTWFADSQKEEAGIPVPYPYPGFWK